jgi:carboxymethylenebutenolidase
MRALVCVLAFAAVSACKRGSAAVPQQSRVPGAQTVSFKSGSLTLAGVVYKPDGSGPFPVILWNHGSYGDPMQAFDEMGPHFTTRGWVFFGPFRRGQGLSASAGPYIGDEIERGAGSDGMRGKARAMVRLLEGDHLHDQLAAYAWLKRQPFVRSDRIAVGGNSFGGIQTVLGAERVAYCAAVDAAGGSQSWSVAPELHPVMLRAARASRAPMFLIQAENDYELTPSHALAEAMQQAGKVVELKIYPPFGEGQAAGHGFGWHGSAIWAEDVVRFLERHCDR